MTRKDRNDTSEVLSRTQRNELLTIGDLDTFRLQLIDEIKSLLKTVSATPGKKWLKTSEVKRLLGVSTGTLQNLRVNGTIGFSKVGGIVFYDYSEIVKLMESNEQRGGN